MRRPWPARPSKSDSAATTGRLTWSTLSWTRASSSSHCRSAGPDPRSPARRTGSGPRSELSPPANAAAEVCAKLVIPADFPGTGLLAGRQRQRLDRRPACLSFRHGNEVSRRRDGEKYRSPSRLPVTVSGRVGRSRRSTAISLRSHEAGPDHLRVDRPADSGQSSSASSRSRTPRASVSPTSRASEGQDPSLTFAARAKAEYVVSVHDSISAAIPSFVYRLAPYARGPRVLAPCPRPARRDPRGRIRRSAWPPAPRNSNPSSGKSVFPLDRAANSLVHSGNPLGNRAALSAAAERPSRRDGLAARDPQARAFRVCRRRDRDARSAGREDPYMGAPGRRGGLVDHVLERGGSAPRWTCPAVLDSDGKECPQTTTCRARPTRVWISPSRPTAPTRSSSATWRASPDRGPPLSPRVRAAAGGLRLHLAKQRLNVRLGRQPTWSSRRVATGRLQGADRPDRARPARRGDRPGQLVIPAARRLAVPITRRRTRARRRRRADRGEGDGRNAVTHIRHSVAAAERLVNRRHASAETCARRCWCIT